MTTRYELRDLVKYGESVQKVIDVKNPESDSPTYVIGSLESDAETPTTTTKASELQLVERDGELKDGKYRFENTDNFPYLMVEVWNGEPSSGTVEDPASEGAGGDHVFDFTIRGGRSSPRIVFDRNHDDPTPTRMIKEELRKRGFIY